MDHNSCGFQKHKSRRLLEGLSIPGEPLRAVATICIKYLGFTVSFRVTFPSEGQGNSSFVVLLSGERTPARGDLDTVLRPGSHPAPPSQSEGSIHYAYLNLFSPVVCSSYCFTQVPPGGCLEISPLEELLPYSAQL